MRHLLNLLAAVALLVWGTQLVRTGVLGVFGADLRRLLAAGTRNRFSAALFGAGATMLVQSSSGTSLMASSFVGQGLLSLPMALAVMRGADVGTALMSVLFSGDLSWLSPLFIFVGVVLSVARGAGTAGQVGRVFVGLGLMLLGLQLVTAATVPLFASPAMEAVLSAVAGDALLQITIGAVLAVVAYSSLAVVLMVAAMAGSQAVAPEAALFMVLGANLGSGVVAVLTTAGATAAARQVTIGNLLFKGLGVSMAAPFVGLCLQFSRPHVPDAAHLVVLYHLAFNVTTGIACIGLTGYAARLVVDCFPEPAPSPFSSDARPAHLDRAALSEPTLAMSNAAREALYQADVVETMLVGLLTVIHTDDMRLARELRQLDDTVDRLHSGIKHYLTAISREALGRLGEAEGRRWSDIIRFTINMEQIGDIVERVISDIEDKKIRPRRHFSDAGMAEIADLHARLVANLRLGMSVFLNGSVNDARQLLVEKTRFRELERVYAGAHLLRLANGTARSRETSALHIDLISELKRINSHICAVAYPVVDGAAVSTGN